MTQISPTARLRLADILDVANELAKIVQGRNLAEYTTNQEFRWGVERALEIIGEAMNKSLKSDPHLIAVIPNAREVTGMRNWLIHHTMMSTMTLSGMRRPERHLNWRIRSVPY